MDAFGEYLQTNHNHIENAPFYTVTVPTPSKHFVASLFVPRDLFVGLNTNNSQSPLACVTFTAPRFLTRRPWPSSSASKITAKHLRWILYIFLQRTSHLPFPFLYYYRGLKGRNGKIIQTTGDSRSDAAAQRSNHPASISITISPILCVCPSHPCFNTFERTNM